MDALLALASSPDGSKATVARPVLAQFIQQHPPGVVPNPKGKDLAPALTLLCSIIKGIDVPAPEALSSSSDQSKNGSLCLSSTSWDIEGAAQILSTFKIVGRIRTGFSPLLDPDMIAHVITHCMGRCNQLIIAASTSSATAIPANLVPKIIALRLEALRFFQVLIRLALLLFFVPATHVL